MGKIAKDQAVAVIGAITDDEVYVFTSAEYNKALDDYKTTEIESALKARIAKVYGDLDADFKEVTGLTKPETEKTYAYWKKVIKDYKDKAESTDVTGLRAEIDRLKTQGGQMEKVRELEATLKLAMEKEAEYKTKISTLETTLKTKDIINQLEAGMHGFKFQQLAQPVLNTFIDSARAKLTKSAQIIDGTIVFIGTDGNPLINRETMKPYTPAEMLTLELDPIMDKGGNDYKGAGSVKKPEITKKDGKVDINVAIPATVKSKKELTEHLIASGLPFNSPEHNMAYDKYSADLPIV